MNAERESIPVREFDTFGQALQFYRENISERIRRYIPGGHLAPVQLTVKDVVSEMNKAGFPISQAAYSDIEQARYLPKEPGKFFEAVVLCLALEQGTPEYQNLMDHLLFDVLKQKFGENEAALYRNEILDLRKSGSKRRSRRPPARQ